jgi:osmotically-inducible protein OsmY
MTVDTLAGTVTLRGFVGSQPLKERATIVVKAVGSVARVDNQLVVDPEAVRNAGPMESSADRATSFRVRHALLEDRGVSSAVPALRITTRNGVVRIEGTVDSEKVKQRIRTVAKAVGSVVQVDDQMKLAEQ